MNTRQRMHPMMMLVQYIASVKSMFFVILLLFVIRIADDSLWVQLGRWGVLIYLAFELVHVMLNWFRTEYILLEKGIEFFEGVLQKKQRYLAYSRVQNVQRKKPFYLQAFHLVMLRLETGAEGQEATLVFPALKEKDAAHIEQILETQKKQADVSLVEQAQKEKRTVHFISSTKDILKASFLSFSYFAIIPLGWTVFSNIKEVVNTEKIESSFLDWFTGSWWMMGLVLVGLLLLVALFGLSRAYIKYGKYEITSDVERIYIRSGVLNEQHFSIRKQQVQAIALKQSLLKRMLGLVTAELVTAGALDEHMKGSNTLYPFLPVKEARSIIEALLPTFEIREEMQKLPMASYIARLLRIPWLFLFGLGGLLIFKPAWWYLALLLLLFTIFARTLDFQFTRFSIHGEFVQLQSGGLFSTLFVTTREKMIELEITQSVLKQPFALANMQTMNRGKPINVQEIKDIPNEWTDAIYQWYVARKPYLMEANKADRDKD